MDTSEIYWSEYYNLTEVSVYCFVSREDANYSNPIFSEKTSPNVQ